MAGFVARCSTRKSVVAMGRFGCCSWIALGGKVGVTSKYPPRQKTGQKSCRRDTGGVKISVAKQDLSLVAAAGSTFYFYLDYNCIIFPPTEFPGIRRTFYIRHWGTFIDIFHIQRNVVVMYSQPRQITLQEVQLLTKHTLHHHVNKGSQKLLGIFILFFIH